MAGAWSKLLGGLGFGDDEEDEDEEEMTPNEQEEKETGEEESKAQTRRSPAAAPAGFDFSISSPGSKSEGAEIKNDSDEEIDSRSTVQTMKKPSEKVVPISAKGGSAMSSSNFSGTGSETSRLIVYAPNRFDEVQVLVDHMKAKRPVIVSLEGLEPELARSMLDFICGAAYALEGTMQKVSGNIFLVAPQDMDVSTNLKEALLARDALVRGREEKEVEL